MDALENIYDSDIVLAKYHAYMGQYYTLYDNGEDDAAAEMLARAELTFTEYDLALQSEFED